MESGWEAAPKVRKYRLWFKKEKAYPAAWAQVPFPYEGADMVEDLVGLTAVWLLASLQGSLSLRDASTVQVQVGLREEKAYPATRAQVPFPYEDADMVGVLVGLTAVRSLPLRDASTVQVMVGLCEEKAYPATRAQVPFPYEDANLVEEFVG